MTEAMDAFRDRLAATSPEVGAMLSEHVGDYDEFLSHVFMGELIAWIAKAHSEARGRMPPAAQAALRTLDDSYTTLGDDVDNAIEASFLEAFFYDELPGSLLGPRLTAALRRMRSTLH
jgi:hypothetical protein